MANYIKFKQGLKKDFNITNQPLTNGMIYFVIDEHNNGSIYYDTIVDGEHATKKGTVHRVKFSGLPIKITGSVTGTGVISKDGESIEINTSTNHSHGLAHQDFTVFLSNDDTDLKWTRLGNQNGKGFWLKSIRGQAKAPAWFLPDYSAGIAFGGADTKGIISVRYGQPNVRFAGGNGDAPVWYFTIYGAKNKTYDLNKIGGHSSDSAKLDHNITFKISKVANATTGETGVTTNLTEKAITFTIPSDLSGFNNIQSTRFQGTADNAGNADTVDGYHAADLFSGGYKTTLDLSALNNNLYYPVTGVSIPAKGYHKIKVSVHLNSGTKPSWATHNSGFTTNVELYTTACGWGATHGETIVLNDSYNFTNCGQVVGFTQNGNTSTPVLWLRGGGKYFVECDYNASWTIRTSLYYTQGSSSDTYHQTVEPQSSYPGFKAGDGGAVNGVIRAGQVYGAVWNDYAEYRQTKECIQPGYCVIETGKGDLIKSSERLQPGANIVSDTFGFAIGETEQTKTPLAVSGRVLAYPYEDRDSYQAGDPVCSGPNGTISKMTREEVREYPDRIIGTVSEIPDYEIWGTGNVKVNNRIWIKVK